MKTPRPGIAAVRKAVVLGGSMMLLNTVVHAANVYVSPSGNDTNDGSKAAPFATLERARDAVREVRGTRLRQGSGGQAQGVTVWLAEGTYVLERTFEMDGRGSGTKDAPVVYRAAEGAIVAGAMLSMRKPVPELFFNEKALPFSRWPNEGWATYGNVIEKGSVPRVGETPDRPGTLAYTGSRPERWTQAERILIHGYFAHDWFDDVLVVDKLDTEQKHMTFTTPHMYGLSPNKRYRALGAEGYCSDSGEAAGLPADPV